MDNPNAEPVRVGDIADFDALTVQFYRPRVWEVHTGENLDQGRFSRTVFAEKRQNFARTQFQTDAVQRGNTTELFAHILQLEEWGFWGGRAGHTFTLPSGRKRRFPW